MELLHNELMSEELAKKGMPKISFDEPQNILLITHTDLDGIGSNVILKYLYNGTISVTDTDTDEVDYDLVIKHAYKFYYDLCIADNKRASSIILDAVTENLETKRYKSIIVTDVSCTIEDAEKIDKIIKDEDGNMKFNLVLLDHHHTSLELNKFNWCYVLEYATFDSTIYVDSDEFMYYKENNTIEVYSYDTKHDMLRDIVKVHENVKFHTCGTALFFDYLTQYCDISELLFDKGLKRFVRMVSYYDTWDWTNILDGDSKYKYLTNLFHIYGRYHFTKLICKYLSDGSFINDIYINDQDLMLLDALDYKASEYVNSAKRRITRGTINIDNNNYNIAYINASDYMPQCFEMMLNEPDVDIAIINSGSSLNFRTRRDDIHVGKIAKVISGGGHPGASGAPIKFTDTLELVKKTMKPFDVKFDM